MTEEQFQLVLTPMPDSRPDVVRLRQLLKLAHRACKLRCVEVKRRGSTRKPGQPETVDSALDRIVHPIGTDGKQ